MAALPRVMQLIREILFWFILVIYIMSTKTISLYADIVIFPKSGNKFINVSTHFWHGFFSRNKKPPKFPKQE